MLLQKELWDEGRRLRTFVIRVVFIFAVFAMVWLGNFNLDGYPSYGNPDLGLNVFVTLALSLVATIMLLGPALTLPSVTTELETGTLDMLLCSQLTTRRIVMSKVIARTIVVMSIVLACAPIMALATYYGGVAPRQAVVVLLLLCSMAFLFAAEGVRIGLTTSNIKSPTGAMVGWLVRYNILTAIGCVNPFIAVSFAAFLGVVWPVVAVVIHIGLGLVAIERVVRRMDFRHHWGVEETWFPERRVVFARAIFSDRQEWEHPLICKELQQGRHATFYVVGCLAIALCAVIDVLSLGGSSWSALSGGLRFSVGLQVMLALFFSALILSEMVSSEKADDTLDLLNLTGVSPRRIIIAKAKSLIMPLKYLTVSTVLHVIVLGIGEMVCGDEALDWLLTPVRVLLGGAAILSTCVAYCAAAIWFAAVTRTRARAAQFTMGTLAAGLIVPYIVAPPGFVGHLVKQWALFTMLAQYPAETGMAMSLVIIAITGTFSWGLLKLAGARLGRIPPE